MKKTIRQRIMAIATENDVVDTKIIKHHFRGRTNESLDNSVLRKLRLMKEEKLFKRIDRGVYELK